MGKFKKRLLEAIKIEEIEKKNLFLGSRNAFIIKIIGLIIGLLLQVFLARILGANDFGTYIYVLTWINTIGFFSKIGFDTASKKIIPVFEATSDWGSIKEYIKFSSFITLIISILVSLLIILFAFFFIKEAPILQKTFFIGALLLIINNQLGLFSSFLESLREVWKGLSVVYLFRPLIIITLVLYFVGVFKIASPDYTIGANILATVIGLFIVINWVKSCLPKEIVNIVKSDLQLKKEWISVASPLLFVSGIHLLLGEVDIIFLGILKGTSEVGIYKAATKFSQLSMFGFNSVELILAPTIARLYFKDDFKGLQNILTKGVLLMLTFTLPIIIFTAVFGKSILSLYGNEFSSGSTSLYILLICQLINLMTGSVSYLLTMTQYQKKALLILSLALILNIILNAVFIPHFGMEGAAVATGITTIFWNLAMLIYVRKKMNLDPSIIGIFKKTN